jgi:UDP-N-acetylmuramate--alanine ligase
MSALAQYCRWSGMNVSGSDRLLEADYTAATRSALQAIGCRLCAQDGSGIGPHTDAVIVSTAIEESNPDISKARSLGIPVYHRSDLLAAIVNSTRSIAVAGTSGKSTVTALIFHLLQECGRTPSLITGANLHGLINQGHIGNAFVGSSDIVVFEADESDGSIVHYTPAISLILNVSRDHKPVPEVIELFTTLSRQSATTIVNRDDANLATVPATRSFASAADATWKAERICTDRLCASVLLDGTQYTVPFPGQHNGRNLLAALSVCLELGCSPAALQKACQSFQGLQRRFDRILTSRDITVIDDYAHNPEKLEAAISTAQSLSPRLHILFQPHGFGPTRFMFDELVAMFARAVRGSDTLFLLPIYYAGGTVQKDISAQTLAAALTGCAGRIYTPEHRDEALGLIAAQGQPGDIVLSMGARDPSLPEFARRIAQAIDGTGKSN